MTYLGTFGLFIQVFEWSAQVFVYKWKDPQKVYHLAQINLRHDHLLSNSNIQTQNYYTTIYCLHKISQVSKYTTHNSWLP